ncbi:MAG: ROK family protein [Candidatus Omnitrophica bacterium]|nr:ROK family protein [Candidatus Omnitrophota bacterium]
MIGIDMGGTKIASGLVAGSKVTKYQNVFLRKKDLWDAKKVMKALLSTIDPIFSSRVKGIGVGVPSVVDRKKGIVYDVVNIPAWKRVPLKSMLEKRFKVPAFVDNDANCFAIGEKLYGKGKRYENFVGLAIGTGIGGGIINRGRLLEDANCGSGEFGEVLYKDKRYEDYCGSLFFSRMHNIDGRKLYDKAKSGNKAALKVFEEFGFHLGNIVKTIMCAVDPEAIIIGGSIAASKQFFKDSMWKQIKTFTFTKSVQRLKIEFSQQTKYAPILGAAAVCLSNITENKKGGSR